MAKTETATATLNEQEKLVKIKIPREKKDKEDVVVWVNNKRYIIKRGVYVDVPESVALVLEQKEQMLEAIYEFENQNFRVPE